MDEDGLFTIVDRKKRMIISGGFNVYPNMIESAIYEHPDVEEAIVIGVPDAYRGETAKAFIKMKDGAVAVDARCVARIPEGSAGAARIADGGGIAGQPAEESVGKIAGECTRR
ncbi:MAG: hypothetical protein WDN04_00325 [Rhodospirillales bacterium]